jgi:cytochrome P450
VRNLTFGSGAHHCIGATLGRRVIHAAIQTLIAHAPAFRAAQPLDDVVGWCSRTASPVARLLIEGVQ